MIPKRARQRLAAKRHKNASILDRQTAAAEESARQSRRAVHAAWASSIINGLVVISALFVPVAQRAWTTFDQSIDDRERDIRVLNASGSELIDAVRLLAIDALFDIRSCRERVAMNSLDRSNLQSVRERMSSLMTAIYQEGAKSPVQVNQHAATFRLVGAVQVAEVNAEASVHRDLPLRVKQAFCEGAIRDLASEASVMKQSIVEDANNTYLPIRTAWPFYDQQAYTIRKQGAEFIKEITAINIPNLTEPSEPESK